MKMIITGTDNIEGSRIIKYMGIVSVRGRLTLPIAGKEDEDYRELHNDLIAELGKEAESLGANAVVSVQTRVDDFVGFYSGTAVLITSD